MRQTLAIRLDPTVEQRAAIVATLERCNAACNAIAHAACRERLASKLALKKSSIARYSIRERFGMSSQRRTFCAVLMSCRMVLYLVLSEQSGAVTAR